VVQEIFVRISLIMPDVILPDKFNSPSYGQMSWEEALEKAVWFLNLDKNASYDVIIGTDSEAVNGTADFVSAIIVHKKGRGGVYFWGRQTVKNLYSLKQRIWHEATLSLYMAQNLVDDFAKIGLFDPSTSLRTGLNLEIHVDIGPNGKTRELITDIVGMIRASGFKVATKPSSWGASHVADRHV
jgi:hypothetical protein